MRLQEGRRGVRMACLLLAPHWPAARAACLLLAPGWPAARAACLLLAPGWPLAWMVCPPSAAREVCSPGRLLRVAVLRELVAVAYRLLPRRATRRRAPWPGRLRIWAAAR